MMLRLEGFAAFNSALNVKSTAITIIKSLSKLCPKTSAKRQFLFKVGGMRVDANDVARTKKKHIFAIACIFQNAAAVDVVAVHSHC